MSDKSRTRPRVMTQDEIEADAIAAEIAAKAELDGTPVNVSMPPAEDKPKVEDKAESPKSEPAKTSPSPSTDSGVDARLSALEATIADKDSRIADLTKRIRDEDGRRGGDLATLRQQNESLGNQVRELMNEIRDAKSKIATSPTPPEVDALETEFPDVAKGVDKRIKPTLDAVARAEKVAQEAKEETARLRQTQADRDYTDFISRIKLSVASFDSINSDERFIDWCKQRVSGTPLSRLSILDECHRSMNAAPVIEIFQQWEALNKLSQAEGKTVDEPKVAKPSKEAQISVPKASGDSSSDGATKVAKSSAVRIKELEDKLYRMGTATKDDRLELDRLYDEAETRISIIV